MFYRGFIAFVLIATLSIAGCGGGNEEGRDGASTDSTTTTVRPPSSSRAQEQSLPEHNSEARFEGKTALEYAADLSDLSPEVQGRALMMIYQFGVDGLPAREKVREVVESERADPEIRLLALGTLVNMQAPEAEAIAREKLADPQFLGTDALWRDFIRGFQEGDIIDEATLRADVVRIAEDVPEHATRLMLQRAFPDDVQQALTESIFEADHNQAARDYFLANFNALEFLGEEPRKEFLTRLVKQDIEAASQLMVRRSLPDPFQQHLTLTILNAEQPPEAALAYFFQTLPTLSYIDDDAKLEFIGNNAPFASRPQYLDRTHQILLSIGTEAAMDHALRYGAMMPDRMFALMIQFAEAKTDPNVVYERMMRDLNQANDQNLVNQIGSYIDLLLLRTSGRGEEGAKLRDRFLSEFGTMIDEGQTENHRAIAAMYLISYVRQAKDVPVLPALEPVFAVLNKSDAPDIVRGTAGAQLTDAAIDLADHEGFIKRAVQALWEGEDIDATHFPEQILRAMSTRDGGVRKPELAGRATRVLQELLDSDIDAHLESWAITPVAALMLTLAGDVNTIPVELYKTPIIEKTSIALGKILTSGKVNTGYKTDEMKFALGTIVYTRTNTLDGLIGLYEPVLLSPQPTVAHQLLQGKFGTWAANLAAFDTYTAAARAEPDVQERWQAFLQKVIDAQIPEVSNYAEVSMARFHQHRQ